MFGKSSRLFLATVLVGILALATGLVGCGGGGGLTGGGGVIGAGNKPVKNATIDAYISGAWTTVGSTDSNGAGTFTSLAGASYPLILKVHSGSNFSGEMYTAMRSASSDAYFTVLHSMWVQRASNLAGGIGAITAANLNSASTEVQAIWELMTNQTGAASFEGSNPLTDGEMAMAQYMFDSAAGVAADYSNLGDVIDKMATDIATGGPLGAITGSFAGVTNAADLVALVEENASSSTAQDAVAAAYSGTMSSATVTAAASTLQTNAASGSVSADVMGVAIVSTAVNGIGGDVKQSDDPNGNTLRFPHLAASQTGAYASYTIVVNIKDSADTNMDGVTVAGSIGVGTVKVGSDAAGTSSSDDTSGGTGNMTIIVYAPGTDQTAGSQSTLTVTFTKGTQVKTYTLPIVYFDATGFEPVSVSINVGQTEGTLLIMGGTGPYVSANGHTMAATVTGAGSQGSFTANTYKVNFYPPEGLKFWDGTTAYDNYLVPVATSGAVDMDTLFGSAPKVRATTENIGAKGQFRAVVTDWAGTALSPSVADSSDPFYQVDNINRVKNIQLQIDNGSGTLGDFRKLTGQTLAQPPVNLAQFKVTLNTWKMAYGSGGYDPTWVTGNTGDVFALQNDRDNEGFVATGLGNYDVTSQITTTLGTTGVTTLADGVASIDLDYLGWMHAGSDNKDAITLIWNYVNTDGESKSMSSNAVYFQATP